ncbi:MAG: hypothetical protein AAF799_05995 [Myxococcota bacterium]
MRLICDDPKDGTELVRSLPTSNPATTVEVRFEPLSPNERLSGEPVNWCNSPATGQPLIYTIPVPQKPSHPPTSDTLKVTKNTAGGTTNFPVIVKRST